jgi:hypothetical protein
MGVNGGDDQNEEREGGAVKCVIRQSGKDYLKSAVRRWGNRSKTGVRSRTI